MTASLSSRLLSLADQLTPGRLGDALSVEAVALVTEAAANVLAPDDRAYLRDVAEWAGSRGWHDTAARLRQIAGYSVTIDVADIPEPVVETMDESWWRGDIAVEAVKVGRCGEPLGIDDASSCEREHGHDGACMSVETMLCVAPGEERLRAILEARAEAEEVALKAPRGYVIDASPEGMAEIRAEGDRLRRQFAKAAPLLTAGLLKVSEDGLEPVVRRAVLPWEPWDGPAPYVAEVVRCGPVGAVWTVRDVGYNEDRHEVTVALAPADPHEVPLTATIRELPMPAREVTDDA